MNLVNLTGRGPEVLQRLTAAFATKESSGTLLEFIGVHT